MKKTIIIGIVFTIIIGSLLHFTYEWSGKSSIVALFSAVNESTWEHLKLLFFPYVLYTLFEYRYMGGTYHNYITAKFLGIVVGLLTIPVIFNVYTAILGTNYLVLDILIFILAVVISYMTEFYILKHEAIKFNKLGAILIVVIMFAFFIFTFKPPKFDIFLDPVTQTYGI